MYLAGISSFSSSCSVEICRSTKGIMSLSWMFSSVTTAFCSAGAVEKINTLQVETTSSSSEELDPLTSLAVYEPEWSL